MAMIKTSVATPNPAVAWNMAGRSMQEPTSAGIFRSQDLRKGVHGKTEAKKMLMLDADTMKMVPKIVHRYQAWPLLSSRRNRRMTTFDRHVGTV